MFSTSNIKLLYSGTTTILQSMLSNKDKNLILDPFSCIIRLALLSFKQEGIKISISNNKISYHEPNFLQGTIRWSNGDNRNDLHNLFNPIIKSLEWFSLQNKKIHYIFKFSSLGLRKLMNSYNKNSVVYHSLKHYAETIENILKNNEVIDDETTNIDEHSGIFIDYDNLVETNKNSIYRQLIDLWTINDINIIYNSLLEIEKYYQIPDYPNINNYISIIEQFLENKDTRVINICVENSTIL